MTALFYFCGFLLSVMILAGIFNYPKMAKFKVIQNLKIKDENEKMAKIYDKKDRPAYLMLMQYAFTLLFLISWTVIGLLSDNWIAFLTILCVYFITSKLISLIGNKDKINYLRTGLYMILYLVIAGSTLFMSLNHFYFKYDLEPYIKSFFIA
jgi:hypothetical protein